MSHNDKLLRPVETMSCSTNVARRRKRGALVLVALGIACSCAGLVSLELPSSIVLETGFKPHQLKALSFIQVSLLTLLAVAMGFWAAPRLGLHSTIVDGAPVFGVSMLIFLVLGVLCGVTFWAIDAVLAQQLSSLELFQSVHEAQLAGLDALTTPIMRLAYGGVTEEILARYGLLSGVALAASMLFKHKSLALGFAIFLSSFLFGIGHLPVVLVFVPDAPDIFFLKTAMLNAAVALLLAMVFVLHSLEASMTTHIGLHLALMAMD